MHKLPKLPYENTDFANQISKESFQFHHGKHHRTYVDNLNSLVADTQFSNSTVEQIIRKCSKTQKLWNNAAQHYNHSFYWNCITPIVNEPSGAFKKVIQKQWGSLASLEEELAKNAVGNFGSGWTWLVKDTVKGNLSILNTSNAQNPLSEKNLVPLLTIDVWEHAYYIDYRNSRASYVNTFVKLINWKFAEDLFESDRLFTV